MQIDIWSDVVCPWCYIGKRRFERALAEFPGRDEVSVVWHSFELDPSAPVRRTESTVEHLSDKYGMSIEQVESMEANVTALAAAEGLDYRLSETKSGNTFDAHRIIHLAAEHGLQDQMKERCLRAYFTESLAITEPETLAELAGQVGLDPIEVEQVLGSDRFAAEVREDEALATRLGITGVPFFVLDGRLGVSGAQSTDVFAAALTRASE